MAVPALILPVSGPYVASFGGQPYGTNDDNGYELSCTIQGQEVAETDAFGLTLVEAIYRGQNWRCRLRGLEFAKVGMLNTLQMFGQQGAAGTLTPLLANIGDRWSKFCQTLLLNAILGSPPTAPQQITAMSAGFAPNSTSAFMMTSKVRELPLELVFLPYAASIGSQTVIVPFSSP